jgi:hypothetical protein
MAYAFGSVRREPRVGAPVATKPPEQIDRFRGRLVSLFAMASSMAFSLRYDYDRRRPE